LEGIMVEYAVLVAYMGLGSLQNFVSSAEVWLSRVNWAVVGYVGLGLIAVRVATWAFRHR
jgi:hypothetical protein